MGALLPPTRLERIGRALGYFFTAMIGFAAVYFPQGTLDTGTEASLAMRNAIWVWALFMATAFPAALATLMGRHRVEFMLIPLFTFALAAANVSVWYTTVTIDNTLMARACASSALICLLTVRWFTLNRMNKIPPPWTLIEH